MPGVWVFAGGRSIPRTARVSPASRPAPAASSMRSPGSSCRPRRSSSPSPAGSPPRSSRAASTPGSFSPSPRPTRRRRWTARRSSRRAGSSPPRRSPPRSRRNLFAFPTRTQLGWLAEHSTRRPRRRLPRPLGDPLMPVVMGEGENDRFVVPGIAESSGSAGVERARPAVPGAAPRLGREDPFLDATGAWGTARGRRARDRADRCGCRSRRSPTAAGGTAGPRFSARVSALHRSARATAR